MGDIVLTATSVPNVQGGRRQGALDGTGLPLPVCPGQRNSMTSLFGLGALRRRALHGETVLFAGRGRLQACQETAGWRRDGEGLLGIEVLFVMEAMTRLKGFME